MFKKNAVKFPSLLLGLAILIYLVVFFYLCFYKYQNFLYNLEDMSIFNNVLYNTVHGKLFWFSSHGGFSYLGDHLELGLLLLAPIYYFFQSPLTLLFLQTALFALSAWPVYLIVRCHCEERSDEAIPMPIRNQRDCFASLAMTQTGSFRTVCRNDKKQWLPLLIALIFLLNPFIHNINLQEFHLAPLLLFFFLWTFYFYLRRKYRLFLLFFILTLLIREDAALTLGALAVMAAWDNRHCLWREKKWWLYPLIISTIWFFVSFKIIQFFNPGHDYKYFLLYQGLLNWPLAKIFLHLFALKNLWLIIGFLLPFIFIPVYRPRFLWLALPTLAQIFLTDQGGVSLIFFLHYQIFILVALFLALIESLAALQAKYPRLLPLLYFLIILAPLYTNFYLGPLRYFNPNATRPAILNLENIKANQEIIKLIPPNASVSAPYRFLPALSSREKIYVNKLAFLGKKHLSSDDFSLPQDTEYLLIDSADMIEYYLHFQNRAPYSKLYWDGAKRMRELIIERKFQPIASTDSLILFQKNAPTQSRPYQLFDYLPTNLKGAGQNFEPFQFLGWQKEKDKINLWWQTSQKINDDYFLDFSAYRPDGELIWQKIYPPAYGLLPTHDWIPGQYIQISQILPTDSLVSSYQISLIKIKGDIELGPLNDTQLIIDQKEYLGQQIIIKD